uniref:Candidate secreted effector n=1 Tax=Meloidogyne incognita TaxID=6306 RepID=A0A914L6B6_MELIC
MKKMGEKGGISYWIALLLYVLLAIKIQNKQKQLTIIILYQLIILLIMNRLKYLN